MNVNPIASNLTAPSSGNGQLPEQTAMQRQLRQAVNTINQAQSYGPNGELTFSFDAETHKPVLQVVDQQTREVQFQIPPEYVLRMAQRMRSEST